MHKKHNLLFILLLIHLSASAQVYFNKSYSPYLPYSATQYIPVGIVNVCETNIGYLTSGSYPTMDKRVLYIVVTDIIGDTICTKTYGETGEVYYSGYGGGMFATTDGNYAISGTYKKDTLSEADGLLLKMNNIGDTLWTKKYGTPTEETFYAGIQSIDGNYYLAGTAYDTIGLHYDMYVVKADSMGNAIWEKKYGGAGSQSASNIQITMDGNILISGYSGSGNNYNALAIKLDTAGNVLWTHSINTNGGGGGHLIETNDGGYVFHGQWRISSLPNFTQYFVQRLNTSKQIQWEQKFYDALNRINVFNDFIEDNNAFIFMGGHQDSMGNKNHSVISKINAAGQKVWHRNINKFARDNYSRDIEKTSDGGFIIAGFGSEFLPNGMYCQEAWLCKVDSFGCLQQGCELFDAIEEKSPTAQEELNVYPNPSKGLFYIQSSQQIETIHIIDISGKRVFEQKVNGTMQETLSLNLPAEGLYLLQVQYSNGTYETKKIHIVK
ncbi:MAG: hypothetical protein KatS3mg027_1820 [Bacteroidia bacterium]|nr:MAG: hypothetical protein KatS3mg027_1820 [Bacteroidia bacterium]